MVFLKEEERKYNPKKEKSRDFPRSKWPETTVSSFGAQSDSTAPFVSFKSVSRRVKSV